MARVEIRETVKASVSPEVLWESLFNPLPLADCLPGATVFERIGENEYKLVLELNTGIFNGSYGGTFHVAENKPYDYFRLAAKASGPLGKVKAIADVNLTKIATGTRAAIVIRADLSGVLGFVGPPAAGLVGRWMVDRFFECIDSVLKKRDAGGCEGCGDKEASTDNATVSTPAPNTTTSTPGIGSDGVILASTDIAGPAPASEISTVDTSVVATDPIETASEPADPIENPAESDAPLHAPISPTKPDIFKVAD